MRFRGVPPSGRSRGGLPVGELQACGLAALDLARERVLEVGATCFEFRELPLEFLERRGACRKLGLQSLAPGRELLETRILDALDGRLSLGELRPQCVALRLELRNARILDRLDRAARFGELCLELRHARILDRLDRAPRLGELCLELRHARILDRLDRAPRLGELCLDCATRYFDRLGRLVRFRELDLECVALALDRLELRELRAVGRGRCLLQLRHALLELAATRFHASNAF